MQIKHRAFQKDGAGSIKVIADDDEDIWHLYNLIRAGDEIRASTSRKVTVGNREDKTERVKVTVTLAVEAVEYAGDSECRCKGRCTSENAVIELGAYHTLTLKPHLPITLSKAVWDRLDVVRLEEAADPAAGADLAVTLIADGLAHVCLIGRSATLLRAKIEVALPKKRGAASVKGYADAERKFLARTAAAIAAHVDFATVRCLVLAGPGFARDKLREYMLAQGAAAEGGHVWTQNKDAIISVPASSAYLQAIPELLSGSGIARQVADTKAAREVAALEAFFTMLAQDSSRAFYGPGHVIAAAEQGAIATLLLSDALYKVHEVKARKQWVSLVESVEAAGGEVFIFSARHESGKQLIDISGVAAILRFGMPELEDTDPAELLQGLSI